MAIIYNRKRKTFAIHTPNTTYICGIYAGKHLIHLYYGSRMDDTDCTYLFGRDESEGDLRHLERETRFLSEIKKRVYLFYKTKC